MFDSKERRTQLLIRDDGKLTFRKLPIMDGFLVEKDGEIVKRGWLHYHKLQFAFPGYKNIPADMVTLASQRDIVLDTWNIVKAEDKPQKGGGLVKTRIQEIAETQRHKAQVKPSQNWVTERVTLFLGIGLILMVLALAGHYALSKGG